MLKAIALSFQKLKIATHLNPNNDRLLDLIGNKTAKMPSNSYAVSILLISWVFLKTLCSKAFTYFRLSLFSQTP